MRSVLQGALDPAAGARRLAKADAAVAVLDRRVGEEAGLDHAARRKGWVMRRAAAGAPRDQPDPS
jgi:hypothetical protein